MARRVANLETLSDKRQGELVQRFICFLALTFALGCGFESTSKTWQAQRRVVGDTVTVHTVAGQVWSSGVRLSEDLAIGAFDGPAELVFGEVSKLAEDPDGGIYVFDRQVPEIRHFDRTGYFLGTIGRSGEGPGEYGSLSLGMVVDPTGVLNVHDWSDPPRIVRFGEAGQALDPWRIPSSFLTITRGTWLYNDGPGRVLVTALVDGAPALIVLEDGQVTDTMAVPRLPGLPGKRGGPYSVDHYWSWHPNGYFVVGVSSEYALEAHRPDGVLRIRRNVERLRVHAEEADAWRRHFEWMEQHPSYRAPEGEWIPSTMPPFRGIEVGTDGRIWVRRNTHPIRVPVGESQPDRAPPVGWEQPFTYDVFEADGTFLGEIQFPEGTEPHLFGTGYVWGVRRGDFDEQYVVRLSLGAAEQP